MKKKHFKCRVANASGEWYKSITAVDAEDAKRILMKQGYAVLAVEEIDGGAEKKAADAVFTQANAGAVNSAAKLEEKGRLGLRLSSLIIPGSGQLARGQVMRGIIYLLAAVVVGILTFGLGVIVVTLISCYDAGRTLWRCSACRALVKKDAAACPRCKARFEGV